jgi:Domain of unknown function (DUF1707)/Domain of unknown function (DUF4190)
MTQPSFGYMRVSDAERERAVDVLKAGFTEGRLTQEEYTDRVSAVHAAQTYNDLAELTYDLPIGPFGTLAPPPPPPGLGLAAPPAGAYPGYSSAPSLQAYPGYLPIAPYAQPGAPYAQPGAPYAQPGLPYAPRLPGYEPAGFFPPGLPPVEPQRDPLAVASLGLALATLAFPPAPFAAVGLGIAALVRMRRTGQRGRNFAIAGIALGTLGILFLVAYILPALTSG